jgi:hypothetical protein
MQWHGQMICEAIRRHALLEFDYDGHHRIVQPYCHGVGSKRREMLRAIQVGGSSRTGAFGFGKLWRVDKMERLRIGNDPFTAVDSDYNPDDSAMIQIHCRV